MKRILLIALALATFAGPAAAEVLIEARYWPADLSGRLELAKIQTNEFFVGFDPINDLGLEEDGAIEARVLFRPSRQIAVRLAWLPLSFTGSAVFTGSIGPIEVSPLVDSTLDLDYGRLALAWQFVNAEEGRFRLGPMIEIKGFQGEASLSVDNPIVPIVQSTDFETAFASAGLMLDFEPSERVHLFAEATTLIDTAEGDLRDGEAGIRVYVTPALAITAGYRLIEIDIADGTDLLEIDIDAVFAGATFKF